ncbi:FIG00642878: hypothetical protein [Escherichia coli ISC7]|uniref:Uncharacterized protein n=1 Tax=Escherichia coli ISC7 TaxID=1432555 RepID=W1F4L1_ECOLX|nr:FIG00642878: hypothetical protein [Escherichia coli ISC7]
MACTHADAIIRFIRPAGKIMLSNNMPGPLSNTGDLAVPVIATRRLTQRFQFTIRGYGRTGVTYNWEKMSSPPQYQVEMKPLIRRSAPWFAIGHGLHLLSSCHFLKKFFYRTYCRKARVRMNPGKKPTNRRLLHACNFGNLVLGIP